MWQILTSEFQYNRIALSFTGAFVFMFFLISLFLGFGGVYGLIAGTMVAYWIMLAVMGSRGDKEKRDRLHMLLPLPLKQISLTRLLFWVIVQSVWLCLWIIAYSIDPLAQDASALWSLFSMNAFMFIVMAPFFIYHDLGYLSDKRFRWLFWAVLISTFGLMLLSALFTDFEYTITFGPGVSKTSLNAISFNVVAAGLMNLSYWVFLKRKSYLA